MRTVYILSAVRSAIGRFGGALRDISPADLAAPVMRAALDRAGVADHLDLVVFGNVLRAGHGQLVPRQAAFKAGIPQDVDALAVDMVCSSGMMSVLTAASMIKANEADVVLAGGVESMSMAGFNLSSRARWGYKYLPGDREPVTDLLFRDGLSDPLTGESMGEQTERLVTEAAVTRQELDEVAFLSHERAHRATQSGAFSSEIAPISYRARKEVRQLVRDEGIRPDTTLETLSALRPAFHPEGRLTPGNSSQISDGAAAIVLASGEAVEARGLAPVGRVLSGAWAAGEPWRFPEAPVAAVRRLYERSGLRSGDFDLFENNEAFALSSVLFHRLLDVPYEQLNVHGGAIALGHPIGCSGARILVTLLHALRRRGASRGLAALCHGTGGGTALAIENVS